MAYLISQGVKPDLITARGLGAAEPLASNATAQGRAQNRRVEVTLAEPPAR
jgi:outer membrane protein OmpA-like peptidoglycan-associated protein